LFQGDISRAESDASFKVTLVLGIQKKGLLMQS